MTRHRILRHDSHGHIVVEFSLKGGCPVNWIQCLSKAIDYIEEHLTDNIDWYEVFSGRYADGIFKNMIKGDSNKPGMETILNIISMGSTFRT